MAENDDQPELQYQYRRLQRPNEIRLIVLHPPADDFDNTIQVSFIESIIAHSSSYDEPYETLSYTWGETYEDGSHLTEDILVRGPNHVPRHKIRVTSILFSALAALRSAQIHNKFIYEKRKLWVDALCINQKDPVERSKQVSMMDMIYEGSVRLHIWLGNCLIPAAPTPRLTCAPIEQRSGHLLWLRQRFFGRKKQADKDSDCQADGPRFMPMTIEDVLQLRWFYRRWIIQEVLYSPSSQRIVWLNAKQYQWHVFMDLLQQLNTNDKPLPPIVTDATAVRDTTVIRQSLLCNLYIWDQAHCQDPRDRIYALLSISRESANFTVDYAMSTEDVYYQVAKRIVDWNQARHLSALLLCAIHRAPERRNLSIPSWVPDWRIPHRGRSTEIDQALRELSKTHKQRFPFCSRVRSFDGAPYLGITGWLVTGHENGTLSKHICNAGHGDPAMTEHQDMASKSHFSPRASQKVIEMRSQINSLPQGGLDASELLLAKRSRPLLEAHQVLFFFPGSQFAFILSTNSTSPVSTTELYRLDNYLPLQVAPDDLSSDQRSSLAGQMMEVFIG